MAPAQHPNVDRLSGLACDWDQFSPMQSVRLFSGSEWRTATVIGIHPDHIVVSAVKAGSRLPVQFAVFDSRNLVATR